MVYLDYIDLVVCCPRKAIELNHSLTHSLTGRRQAIICTNAGILSFGPSEKIFSEVLIKIQSFSFKKIYLKMSSA